MRLTKKLMSLLLTITMITTMMPVIAFAEQSEPVNEALGKRVVASSIEGPSVIAEHIVSGDREDGAERWGCKRGSGPEWIYVDLGKETDVKCFCTFWESAKADKYKIQIANTTTDPEEDEWVTVAAFDGPPEPVLYKNINVLDVIVLPEVKKARYVRLYIDHFTAKDPMKIIPDYPSISIFEFEVYGDIPSEFLPMYNDDKESAEAVDRKINDIGDVTLESETAINEARKAYEELSSKDKFYVTKHEVLEAASAEYDAIKAADDKAAAEAASVDKMIAELGEITLENREAVAAAGAAYDALSPEAKEKVENLAILEEAEKMMLQLEKEYSLENGKAELTHRDFTAVKGGYKITAKGKHINAKPVVTNMKGEVLEAGKDYTVTYSSEKRVAPGRYTVTVKGAGNYTGELSIDFIITPAKPAKAEGRLSKLEGGYDDAVITWSRAEGATGYSVKYRKAGDSKWSKSVRTTRTKLVIEDLTDGRTYEFNIKPYYTSEGTRYMSTESETVKVTTLKKVNLKSALKSPNGKVTLRWDNIAGERGYQISKSTKKDGAKAVKTYRTAKKDSILISAEKGTGYYYKVRAYQVADGKMIYGPWSSAKYCKLR